MFANSAIVVFGALRVKVNCFNYSTLCIYFSGVEYPNKCSVVCTDSGGSQWYCQMFTSRGKQTG